MQPHPRFCSRDTVSKLIKGKHVALIGSGPGLLLNAPGFIDSHELVIRVNNYAITGLVTGKRTDVLYSFFGSSIRKRVPELLRDGVKLCMCKCPDAKFMESDWHDKHGKPRGVDFRYIYEERKDYWFTDTYVPTVPEFLAHFNLLGGHVPTTGFSALLDVLSYEPAQIFLSGYDFFQSKIHNLNEAWKPQNPDDPIGHVPDAEREWFVKNMDSLPVTMDEMMKAALKNEVRPQRSANRRRFRPRPRAA